MKFLKEMISKNHPEDVSIENVAAMIDDAESEEGSNAQAFSNLAAIQSKLKGLQSGEEPAEDSDYEEEQIADFQELVDDIRQPENDRLHTSDASEELAPIMSDDDFSKLDDELARMSDELVEEENSAQAKQSGDDVNGAQTSLEKMPENPENPQASAADMAATPAKGTDRAAMTENQHEEASASEVQAPNVFGTPSKVERAVGPQPVTIRISEQQGGGAPVPVPAPDAELAAALLKKAISPIIPEAKPEAGTSAEATADIVEVPMPAAGRSRRRAGRVKTRLLGFEHSDGGRTDPFSAESPTTVSNQVSFPVGWIVVVKGPGRGTAFALFNGVSKIGRAEDQAIKLDFGDTSISRDNHAAIAYDSEQHSFFLGHGGKANLVRLNDKPVLSTEEVSNNDLIRIGETTLRFVALCGREFNWDAQDKDETDNAAST